MRFNIIHNMRLVSVILLLSFCLFSLSPVLIIKPDQPMSQEESIMTLNVCSNHGSILNNIDMPFMYECPCRGIQVYFAEFYDNLNTSFKLPLITLQRDYPPKV